MSFQGRNEGCTSEMKCIGCKEVGMYCTALCHTGKNVHGNNKRGRSLLVPKKTDKILILLSFDRYIDIIS